MQRPSLPLAVREIVKRKLARVNLLDFIMYTKPDYLAGWFQQLLCRRMDRFLQRVVNKEGPRMLVFAPPRHGKTEIVSRRFPAYCLGRYPDMAFIGTSWGNDLASSINRDVQRVICSEEYGELFPDTNLWGKNIRTVADGSYLRNSDIFEVVNHRGVYKSAGRGGGIPGRGGDIILMDDVVKDNEEAFSETVRASTWDWYVNDLYTRKMPGAGILLIITRRHEFDIAGHLLDNMKKGGEQWEVISFPAVAEHDEFDEDGTLLRKEGDPLHKERYSLKELMEIKIGTADEPGVGSKVWASLYQQRPSAAEGNLFKREWWKFLRPIKQPIEMGPSERRAYFRELGILRIIQRWDTALGETKQDDYTSCVTLGIARNRYYIIDVWKGKLQFPDVKRAVQQQFDKWHPQKVYVEGGGSASGKATVQAMKRECTVPIFETITSTDKVLRADTVSPAVESGFVTILEGGEWCAGFVDNCANFPNAQHDDDVDAFIGAMETAMTKGAGMHISDDFLAAIGA